MLSSHPGCIVQRRSTATAAGLCIGGSSLVLQHQWRHHHPEMGLRNRTVGMQSTLSGAVRRRSRAGDHDGISRSRECCAAATRLFATASSTSVWAAEDSDSGGAPYDASRSNTNRPYIRLSVVRPDLVGEWVPELNDCDVQTVSASYKQEVWWRCVECGNNYLSSVRDRVTKGSGCPRCHLASRASPTYPARRSPSATEGGTPLGAAQDSTLASQIKVVVDWIGTPAGEPSDSAVASRLVVLHVGLPSGTSMAPSLCSEVRVVCVRPSLRSAQATEATPDAQRMLLDYHPELAARWDYAKNWNTHPGAMARDSAQSVWWVPSQWVVRVSEDDVKDLFGAIDGELSSSLSPSHGAVDSATEISSSFQYYVVCLPSGSRQRSIRRTVHAFVRYPWSWTEQKAAQAALEDRLLQQIEQAAHIKEAIASGLFDVSRLPIGVRIGVEQRVGSSHLLKHLASSGPLDLCQWNQNVPDRNAVAPVRRVYAAGELSKVDNGLPKHILPLRKLQEIVQRRHGGSVGSLEGTSVSTGEDDGLPSVVGNSEGVESPSPSVLFRGLVGRDLRAALVMWESQQRNADDKALKVAKDNARAGTLARPSHNAFSAQPLLFDTANRILRAETLSEYVRFTMERRRYRDPPAAVEGSTAGSGVTGPLASAVLYDSDDAGGSQRWSDCFRVAEEDVSLTTISGSACMRFFQSRPNISAPAVSEARGPSAAHAATRSEMPPRPAEAGDDAPQEALAHHGTLDYFMNPKNPRVLIDTQVSQSVSDDANSAVAVSHEGSYEERVVTIVQRPKPSFSMAKSSSSVRHPITWKLVEFTEKSTSSLARGNADAQLTPSLPGTLEAKRTSLPRRSLAPLTPGSYVENVTASSAQFVACHGHHEDSLAAALTLAPKTGATQAEHREGDGVMGATKELIERALESDTAISVRRGMGDTYPHSSGLGDPEGLALSTEEASSLRYQRLGPGRTSSRHNRNRGRFNLFKPKDEYFVAQRRREGVNTSNEGDTPTSPPDRSTVLKKRLANQLSGVFPTPGEGQEASADDTASNTGVVPRSPRKVSRPRRVVTEETQSDGQQE